MTILLSSITKRVVGRPKKNMRKDLSEEPKSKTKLSRKGTPIMCYRCKKYEHNKLDCKKTSVEQLRSAPQPTPSTSDTITWPITI